MLTIISDGQTLLFILALLYLTECLMWVKKQSVAFVSASGKRWRIATPISWLGNANGAMLILNPLPPPGRVFLSHLLPVSISPSGVCAFNSQTLPSGARPATQTGEFIPFSSLTQTGTDGAYLVLNGQKFAKCASAKQAKALASVIEAASSAKPSRRETIVRSWIAKQFDARAATRVWSEAESAIGPIRWVCFMAFVFMFVATPVLVTIFGLERVIIAVGAAILLLAVQIAIMFYRVHRRFYPTESSERLESMAKMIVCPPVSLRAADVLTKGLLAEYSPVLVANVLAVARDADGQQFVRSFVLDLKHPLKHEIADDKAVETIDWMNTAQLKACLEHIGRDGHTKAKILLSPAQREGDSVSYCPRCGIQFVAGAGDECPDCPGVGLVAFADHIEEVTLSQTSG